jgi:hypothetical protein
MAAAAAEIGEGHVIAAADLGVDFVDLAGEAVGRKPPGQGVGVEEGFIDALGGSAEDAVEADGAWGSGHGEVTPRE